MKKDKLPKNLIIDRKKWLRGEGSFKSYLLRLPDGKQCCLGQIALQCGYSERKIEKEVGPEDIDFKPFINKDGFNTSACERAMSINDNEKTTDKHKEKYLKNLFKKEYNSNLKFIN